MSDTFKFPNGGYEVTVHRKQDIIDCIDANIVDKEIALAIVEQCEIDAVNFIKEGKWTGLPFIGNLRIPKAKALELTSEQQLLIEEAKELIDPNQYILFRRQLSADNHKRAKYERYYRYMTSIAVNRNKKLYKKLCKEKGECYARIYLYGTIMITAVNNEFIEFNNYE